ncbi:unnamed protein product [Haemonchus placei]|uniref:Secreted protein n=1 Tax=Haemonchus placei TaxID=6290 RepID=A0A0N4X9T8_HAEPC|nr:unnamed protein product [Haemonchus placei]
MRTRWSVLAIFIQIRPCHTHIVHDHDIIFVHSDVFGLDVTMDKATLMHVVDCLQQL